MFKMLSICYLVTCIQMYLYNQLSSNKIHRTIMSYIYTHVLINTASQSFWPTSVTNEHNAIKQLEDSNVIIND